MDDRVFDALVAGPDDGTPVLLLHGFPQTSWSWRAQLAALSAAGHRAVAFDQRGYSPGARPTSDEAYRLDAVGRDVVGVADALGVDRFHLVGHDWGGVVAWWVAATSPERLRSVASLSTPHPAAFAEAMRHLDQRRRSAYMPLFRSRLGPAILGGADHLGLRTLFALGGLPSRYSRGPLDVAARDPGWLPAALAWYRANDLTAVTDVGDITVPTLFAWGAADPALGPHAAYATGEHVVGPYRFVPLPGAGHWLPELAADAVNRLLLEHVAVHT